MVKDGYKFAAAPLILGIVALLLHSNWIGGVLIFLGVFVLFFFRDPERTPPADQDTIFSPADGRILEGGEESANGMPGGRISVFFSVFALCVNKAAGGCT